MMRTLSTRTAAILFAGATIVGLAGCGGTDGVPSETQLVGSKVGQPPVAQAGPDRTIVEGTPFTLSGKGSYDPDGKIVSYVWRIEGMSGTREGITVTIDFVPYRKEPYIVILTVTDNEGNTASDRVEITVVKKDAVNHPPTAIASISPKGAYDCSDDTDYTSIITLDASHSSDPDLETLSYAWSGTIGGNTVSIKDLIANKKIATTTIAVKDLCNKCQAEIGADTCGIIFNVDVTDPEGLSDNAHVSAHVSWPTDDTPPNSAPVAVNDTAETMQDTAVTVDILANDSDSDGTLDPATVNVSSASNGTVVVNVDGSITYTPNSNFSGTETLTYQVKDNDGAPSNSATVTITVKSAYCWKTISDPVLDINQSEAAELPSMVGEVGGNDLYVAWTEGGWNTSSYNVKQYTGGAWHSLGGAINDNNGMISSRAVLKLNGAPYVYYNEDNPSHINKVKKWDGSVWQEIYSESNYEGKNDMAFSQEGKPYILYTSYNVIYVKKYNGSTWDLAPTLDLHTSPYIPRMLIKQDGTPIVVVDASSSGYDHTRLYDYNGTAWKFEGYLESNSTNRQIACRSMLFDQNGDLVIAYVEKATPNPGDYAPHIFVKRFNDSGVETIGSELNGALSVDISGGMESGRNYKKCISLALDLNGAYYVAWQHTPSGQKREIHTLKYDGSSWSEAAKPLKDDQNLRLPTLVIDADGRMNISTSYDSSPGNTDNDDVKVYRCDP